MDVGCRMDMVRIRRKFCRRGAAAVEVALVMPLILLVTFGAIRYGWFFLKLQQITNAARCGVRASVVYTSIYDPDLHTEVETLMYTLLGPYGAHILESGDPVPATYEINGATTTDVGLAGAQDKITGTITVPAADVDILPITLFNFEPDDWNLRASVTMAKEGTSI